MSDPFALMRDHQASQDKDIDDIIRTRASIIRSNTLSAAGMPQIKNYDEVIEGLNRLGPTKAYLLRNFNDLARLLLFGGETEGRKIEVTHIGNKQFINTLFQLAPEWAEYWRLPVIPCFWSNVFMEKEGALEEWNKILTAYRERNLKSKNVFLSTKAARDEHSPKVAFLNLLSDIGGVALQANVNMETSRFGEVAEKRDSFFIGEQSAPKTDAANWIGKVMSYVYASTVLNIYLGGPNIGIEESTSCVNPGLSDLSKLDSKGNSICLYLGDFRRGTEMKENRVLPVSEIAKITRAKDFTKIEWPQILRYTSWVTRSFRKPVRMYIIYNAPINNALHAENLEQGIINGLELKHVAQGKYTPSSVSVPLHIKFIRCGDIENCVCRSTQAGGDKKERKKRRSRRRGAKSKKRKQKNRQKFKLLSKAPISKKVEDIIRFGAIPDLTSGGRRWSRRRK